VEFLQQRRAAEQHPDAFVIDSQWLRSQTSDVAAQLCELMAAAGYVRHVSTSTQLVYTVLSPATARPGASRGARLVKCWQLWCGR
jgi:hypothetical protein